MNTNLYRVIFNAARKQRMVVAETTRRHGGAGAGDASARHEKPSVARITNMGLAVGTVCGLSLLCLAPFLANAQIKADPSAPGRQRPVILQTANGVPLVNITAPSPAGVSRNRYLQFDVDGNGVVLNNVRSNAAPTQIGGWVQANPFLGGGGARVILNEVNSSNPTYLNGPTEVAGQRAEVVIANPSGIRVNGGTFLNAAGVTLTTGAPVLNEGHLESFRVTQGSVYIEGLGLDTGTAEHTRILARAMEVNAGLWAKDLTVVTGANEVKALASGAQASTTKIDGVGVAPTFMLDVGAIGGMYAGHIYLVGTETGLGVNNRGTLTAQDGTWELRSDGWLVNTGRIQAKGDLTVRTTGAVSNIGPDAVVSSQGNADIESGEALSNTGGATLAATGNLTAIASGMLTNAGGVIAANGAVEVAALGIDNALGAIASIHSTLTVDSRSQPLTNSQGMLSAGDSATINSAALDNDQGLVQAGTALLIDTHGGALINTNSGSAGIVSGGTVTLNTGDLRNTTGYIGAGGTLIVRSSGQVMNTEAGQIASGAGIDLVATTGLDNQGGSLQALGGIGITAPSINNANGEIVANGNVVLIAADTLNNAGGTLAAGRTLSVQDSGSIRSLAVTNTGGTVEAGVNALLTAASLTGDGTVQAAGDLSIDLQRDFESTTDIVAGGNASLTTTGTFTNRASLNAGQTVSVRAYDIDNTQTGEIAGSSAMVSATRALTNRGLIDGSETRIDAVTLTNIGMGRIYGDHVGIAATTLTNDTEMVGGARADAVIAARERLDLGVTTLDNREHALVFSAGSAGDALNIGGALDAQGRASGRAAVVNNDSATIESLGGMSIEADRISNTNLHFSTEVVQKGATTSTTEYSLGPGDVAQGRDLATHFRPDEVSIYDCESLCMTVLATGDTSDGHTRYEYTSTPFETVVRESDPGKIIAGGNLVLRVGTLFNDRSQILAGDALSVTADNVQNTTVEGERRWVHSGTATSVWRARRSGRDTWASSTSTYNPADTVEAITLTPTRLEGSASVVGSGTTVAVRVVTPDASAPSTQVLTIETGPTTLPTSSLFRQNPNPGQHYLIETDPRFTDGRQWLGSDYMLSALSYDPATVQKRLGDGFYEQRLVREQIAQLTGQRFLDGYANDEEQYRALLESGVTFAKQWGLVPGVALTAEQMARLTSDIVWLVAQEVTLPDGTKTMALVPQVYVRGRTGDLAPSGALLSGRRVNMNLSGDLANSGTIAGRAAVRINARNLQNLGDITGQSVDIDATQDLLNLGGRITARDTLVATAGRDLTVQSTTRTTTGANGSRTGIDRVAGLYVTGRGGILIAHADNDLNVVAGVLSSNGGIEATAGNNVNLATVTTSEDQSVAWNDANWRKEANTQEVGSQIAGAGGVYLGAGNDLNARAAAVDAGGALMVVAEGDLNITAGQNTRSTEEASQHKSRGTLSSRTLTTYDKIDESQAAGSSFGGNTVALVSGGDTTVRGSSVVSDRGTILASEGDLTIEAAQDTYSRDSDRVDKKSGVFSGGGIGVTAGTRRQETNQNSRSTTTAASTIGAIDGDVTLVSGGSYRQRGSDVLAPGGDVDIEARDIEITESRETSSITTEQHFKQSGLTVQISSPVISAVETAGAMAKAARDTRDDRMKALAVANTAFAANNAANAIEAGQGVTTPDGKTHQVTRTDVDGTRTTSDANAADRAGGVTFTASIGSSKSSSTTTQTRDTGRGSAVSAGGSVNINAKGAGEDSDVEIRGSNVNAGKDVHLAAEGDVALSASKNTENLSGSNKSSSASIGVSAGTSGFGVTASASGGRGSEAGSDVSYRNTHVTGGDTVTIQSGGDADIRGAVVRGDAVKADVGGDLSIESLQDTSTYTSKQRSAGASVTVGAGGGGSFNASKSNIDSDYRSVAEQSGIKAGDAGFDVVVKGDTHLTGGSVASNQDAVDKGRNRFETGGELSTSDLQNTAQYRANSTSVGGGVGQVGKNLGVSGVGAGVGEDSGSASSTTSAGISGIAGDKNVRSTDAETGIARIFDKERVQREIDAQARITEAFGREASKAVGDYATQRFNELKDTDPEEAAKWADGGAYRVLAHAIIGGLTGDAAGAAGAGMAAWSADYITKATEGLPEGVKNLVGAAIAAGVGAAVGGYSGAATAFNSDVNNRQLHPSEKELAKKLAAQSGGKYTVEQIEEQMRLMGNVAFGELPNTITVLTNIQSIQDSINQDPNMPKTAYGNAVVEIPGQYDADIQQYIIANTKTDAGWIPGGSPYGVSSPRTSGSGASGVPIPSSSSGCANGDLACLSGIGAQQNPSLTPEQQKAIGQYFGQVSTDYQRAAALAAATGNAPLTLAFEIAAAIAGLLEHAFLPSLGKVMTDSAVDSAVDIIAKKTGIPKAVVFEIAEREIKPRLEAAKLAVDKIAGAK